MAKDSRMTTLVPVHFGEQYDAHKMRVLSRNVSQLHQSMLRIEALLMGGTTDQVLTKTSSKDFSGQWAEPVDGGAGVDPEVLAASILTAEDETAYLASSRRLLAGTNISIDLDVPGEATINATGSGGGVGGNSYFPAGWA